MIKRLKQKIDGKFTNGKVIYQGALELYSMRKNTTKLQAGQVDFEVSWNYPYMKGIINWKNANHKVYFSRLRKFTG